MRGWNSMAGGSITLLFSSSASPDTFYPPSSIISLIELKHWIDLYEKVSEYQKRVLKDGCVMSRWLMMVAWLLRLDHHRVGFFLSWVRHSGPILNKSARGKVVYCRILCRSIRMCWLLLGNWNIVVGPNFDYSPLSYKFNEGFAGLSSVFELHSCKSYKSIIEDIRITHCKWN